LENTVHNTQNDTQCVRVAILQKAWALELQKQPFLQFRNVLTFSNFVFVLHILWQSA